MLQLPFPRRQARRIIILFLLAAIPGTVIADSDRVPLLVPIEGPPAAAGLAPSGSGALVPSIADPSVPQLLPSHPEGDKGSFGTPIVGPPPEPTAWERQALEAARAATERAAGSAAPPADRDALEAQKLALFLVAPRISELGIDPAACLRVDLPEVQEIGPPGLNEVEAAKLRQLIEAEEVQP